MPMTKARLRRHGLAALGAALGLFGACGVVRTCDPSGDGPCPAGMFCKVDDGVCDSGAVAGVCAALPDVCVTVFDPVCGCDGQTYANACRAHAAGVNVAHDGECRRTDCCDPALEPGVDDNPFCVEGASCCADGTWMCNDGSGDSTCDALCGQDGEVCGGIAGLACDDPGAYCRMPDGRCCCDFTGVCTPKPEVCIELFDPVCGCDGKTYSNGCFASMAGVSVDHAGACSQ